MSTGGALKVSQCVERGIAFAKDARRSVPNEPVALIGTLKRKVKRRGRAHAVGAGIVLLRVRDASPTKTGDRALARKGAFAGLFVRDNSDIPLTARSVLLNKAHHCGSSSCDNSGRCISPKVLSYVVMFSL